MTTLLLTGPPSAGKTTIASALAERIAEPLAIIEVDILRHMIVGPHAAPWDDEEGHRQQLLGVRNACVIAQNFDATGFHVLIVDSITDETAARYREELVLTVVRLLPNWEQTMIRSQNRDQPLRFRERELLYEQQQQLEIADITIDNSALAPNIVAERLQRLLSNTSPNPPPAPPDGYHALSNPPPPPSEGAPQ